MCLLGPRGVPAVVELSTLVYFATNSMLDKLRSRLASLYMDGHTFRGKCMLLPEAYTLLHVIMQNHTMAKDARYSITALLLEFGFCPNAKDMSGCSAFWYAMQRNEPDLVKLFLEFGADYGSENLRGWNCLARAVSQGAIQSVRAILEHSPNLSGVMPARSVPELIRRGASIPTIPYPTRPQHPVDTNQIINDNSKRTVLNLAVLSGAHNIVQLLLKHGASPDVQDVFGRTCIHHAVLSNALDTDARLVLRALLRMSKNVDAVSDTGVAPWQYAVTKPSAMIWLQAFAYAGSNFDWNGPVSQVSHQALVYAKTMHGRSVVERIALHRHHFDILCLIPKLNLKQKFELSKYVSTELPVIDGIKAFEQPALSKELTLLIACCTQPYGPTTFQFYSKCWPESGVTRKSSARALIQCTQHCTGIVQLPPELAIVIISFF